MGHRVPQGTKLLEDEDENVRDQSDTVPQADTPRQDTNLGRAESEHPVKLAVLQFYKVDDTGKVQKLRKECPNQECGAGTFMANHFDRHYCVVPDLAFDDTSCNG
ncbi:hypothetical protein GIB67_004364 [Kingdonia uniflora]|uniref:Small ribosomal subunit protein eS31 domain-containing protein n=1 Tax=Kingdonia uniflora TaxID=39325 RepID=A0A7J7MRB5_9MAGN|nr:hypothetical protein GIB67_004364 [Kingdonia uniflora]